MYYILGTLINEANDQELVDCVKYNDPAANHYQKSLYNGLVENDQNVGICSYKTVSSGYYSNQRTVLKKYGSLKNDVVIKRKSYLRNFVEQIFFFYGKLIRKVTSSDILFVYSLDSSRLLAAQLLKKVCNVRTCVVVTDLPLYMSAKKSLLYKFLKGVNNLLINGALKKMDCFILLSKHMREQLPINNKPFLIVEGMYLPLPNVDVANRNDAKKKIVLYSGAVSQRYGVRNLVDAFCALGEIGYDLWICGNGDQELIDYMLTKNNVKYLGVLPYEDVVRLQKEAQLLVNPRTPEGEYVKYSFPSKTMEYFASGTPVLMYELPGIPEEYYDFCYSLKDESIEALTTKLQEVLNMDEHNLNQMGQKAQEFIIKQKLAKSQCSRILKFIDSLK